VVRHPIYAGYALTNVGYVLSFPSARNLVVVAVAFATFYIRAVIEERFLAGDPVYQAYSRDVRWRFLPFVH
jgi:protein-S-isoprenylcysteine O-methyltransferase Ste14